MQHAWRLSTHMHTNTSKSVSQWLLSHTHHMLDCLALLKKTQTAATFSNQQSALGWTGIYIATAYLIQYIFSLGELKSLSSHLTLHYDMLSVWIIHISRSVCENQSAQTILCGLSESVRGEMCERGSFGFRQWQLWWIPTGGGHEKQKLTDIQTNYDYEEKCTDSSSLKKVNKTDKLSLTHGLISLSTVL